MGREQHVERNAEIVRLRLEGHEQSSIATMMKLTPQTVSGVLHRKGLTDKTRRGGRSGKPESVVLAAVDFARHYGRRAAAHKFGVTVPCIANWQRRYP